jgi:CRISPR-associated protein Cmr2
MSVKICYTAITIGPINDTISLTSSPAGLWAGSYIFSHISRRLCELLVDENNKLVKNEKDILSPYFCKNEIIIDGIGRYHDHIVFKPANEDTILKDVQTLFEQVTKEIANVFEGTPVDWFKQYLQLHALCFKSEDNPILDCSKYLDAIELEKTFPTVNLDTIERKKTPAEVIPPNPLNVMFEDSKKNLRIRENIRDTLSDKNWPFEKEEYTDKNGKERMPDMEDITGRRKETDAIKNAKKDGEPVPKRQKINSYYAIVQSDGDRFGEYIKKQYKENKEDLRDFSKKCLKYCSCAADMVKTYGGVPIYAGGDDLLFITSLTGKLDESAATILDLLVALREKFDDTFWEKEGDPTLSFGVAIRYHKYPLYEAFDEARQLLFHRAKRNRNAAAISLQKHSGKDVEFVLENFKDTPLTERLQCLIKRERKEKDETLSSIRSKIWEFEKLFSHAISNGDQALKNVFDNTFDSDIHKKYGEAITGVRELLKAIPTRDKEEKLKLLDSMLRFAKFWGEEGDDGDANTTD